MKSAGAHWKRHIPLHHKWKRIPHRGGLLQQLLCRGSSPETRCPWQSLHAPSSTLFDMASQILWLNDGGPQYTSEACERFYDTWGFRQERSVSGNSKANGAAASAVKIEKRLMWKAAAVKEGLTLVSSICETHSQRGWAPVPLSTFCATGPRPGSLPLRRGSCQVFTILNKNGRCKMSGRRRWQRSTWTSVLSGHSVLVAPFAGSRRNVDRQGVKPQSHTCRPIEHNMWWLTQADSSL